MRELEPPEDWCSHLVWAVLVVAARSEGVEMLALRAGMSTELWDLLKITSCVDGKDIAHRCDMIVLMHSKGMRCDATILIKWCILFATWISSVCWRWSENAILDFSATWCWPAFFQVFSPQLLCSDQSRRFFTAKLSEYLFSVAF